MAEGRCASFSRYMLIIFNFVFWISGGAVLGMGIFVLVSDKVENLLQSLIDLNVPLDFLYTSAYIMVAVGAFVFFAGFCGCCGAVRESAFMLVVYMFCMALVMCGELAAGIFVAVKKGDLEQTIHTIMDNSVRNYTGFGNSTADFLQTEFRCCGTDNYTDYINSFWFLDQQRPKLYVPETCCKGVAGVVPYKAANLSQCEREAAPQSPVPPDDRTQLRSNGCFHAIIKWIENRSVILICVVIGITIIEILGIIFAVCLCRNRTEYYE